MLESTSQRMNKSTEEVRAMWLNAIPSRRFAEASETAQAVCFLASSAASYVNGVNLPVDGGRTVCL